MFIWALSVNVCRLDLIIKALMHLYPEKSLKTIYLSIFLKSFLSHTIFVLNYFCGGSDGKESARNAEGPSSIPGSRRPPEEGNGNPLQ